jgi:hypothetical protein
VVAHDKDFAITLPHRPSVKLKGRAVKRSRARLLVILKGKPEPLKLLDLLTVFVSLEIDDVSDAQGLKLFDVSPSCYRATKG